MNVTGMNVPEKSRPAAIILAAGYSSRMFAHKALYPVGGELMLQRAVRTLARGGIDDIYIVTGYKSEVIQKISFKSCAARIRFVYNPDFRRGMYSSVLSGVRRLASADSRSVVQNDSAAGSSPGFLLLPVDYPFVSPATVSELIQRFALTNADIVSPADSAGRSGHPPVIRSTVFPAILAADSPLRGLASILEQPDFSTETLQTSDSAILEDADDDEAYLRLLRKHTGSGLNYPDAAEIERLIRYKAPAPAVVRHMEKTAALAVEYAERLNSRGALLNPGLLYAAAMLHDVCRSEPDHAAAGAQYLSAEGYQAVGRIVSQHMNIDHGEDDELDESAVLYLADKQLEGEQPAALKDRLENKLAQFAGNEEACRNIKSRFEKAALIKRKTDEILTG